MDRPRRPYAAGRRDRPPGRDRPAVGCGTGAFAATWTIATAPSRSSPASCGPAAGSWRPGTVAPHLAKLWALIGFEYHDSPFGRETGRAQLERHFASVAALAAARRPEIPAPFVARGDTAVFVAGR